MALQLFSKKPVEPKVRPRPRPRLAEPDAFIPADRIELQADPLHQAMQLERYAYLIINRSEFKEHPDVDKLCLQACERIDDSFALVPEGFATIPRTLHDSPGAEEDTFETTPFLLGKHCVTNAQYQKFVEAGGYEQLELWPKELWPHLIDFKDLTECPGPRYWRHGRPSKKLMDHPVVGVCQFEAAAYARWAGFRLPTEAEWQMAATWRIRSVANTMRRYPWGDALDINRCNIWATGQGRTVPVDEYQPGAAPNGVLQLIGNVWEWTASDFEVTDHTGGPVVGDMHMATIRGGAYDTYFQMQATSVFRTGLVSLARAHNVGFRLAWNLRGN
ncbi:MAG: formylglycine-generating enzyme family protein [Phycisphaerae bacterium]|nr:formylglycine-generating enzyme family protein [Phycisphaerae bacterium]